MGGGRPLSIADINSLDLDETNHVWLHMSKTRDRAQSPSLSHYCRDQLVQNLPGFIGNK